MKLQLRALASLSFVGLLAACGGPQDVRAERADCRRGDEAACVSLGDRYVDGDEVEQDVDRAARIYLSACRNNPASDGCQAYVALGSDDASQSIDVNRALEIVWRPCRRYDVDACDDVLELLENPDLATYDPEHGQRVRDRLCLDGWDVFCGGLDSDGDGISDQTDECILRPEDVDGWEDADGCPDPDNDGDGMTDDVDQCPDDPEDVDGFADEDGCPDPDNDEDGVLDVDDGCPDAAEDFDAFEDTDGCPEADNDFDGILDDDDLCPNEPEDVDGFEDADGCPEEGSGLVTLTCDAIVISDKVYFETGSAVIQSRSFDLLDQVAGVLSSVTYISLVEVGGHTDDRGGDDLNMQLSDDRAAAVRTYLMDAGVDEARLRSVGYGETVPIADNGTRSGRAENRRVEFNIVEQDSRCAD